MFGSKLLNPVTIAIALGAATAIGGAAFGAGRVYEKGKAFDPALEMIASNTAMSISREINLWQEQYQCRGQQIAQADLVQDFFEVNADQRLLMSQKVEKATADARKWRTRAETQIELLRKAKKDAKNRQWLDAPIPVGVTCGVFNGSGCGDTGNPASTADSGDLDVREGAASEG